MRMRLSGTIVLCLAALWTACGGSPTQPSAVTPTQTVPPINSLSAPPSRPLSKTRFVAFGDSITAGTIATPQGLLQLIVAPQSYPAQLETLLSIDHPDQRIQVYNEGVAGEPTFVGINRLPGVLSADQPQVLLLLEGVNDLDGLGAAGIQPTIANLGSMIAEAQGQGITVFVGTLLPQVPGGYRAFSINLIVPFNDALKQLVAGDGATLVDFYTPFAADMSLIGYDGLHPNAAGYLKMAQIWEQAINSALEIPLPTATTSSAPPGPNSTVNGHPQ